MKGIIHIRIDDRLIHGQVASRWSTGLKATRIMVINDEVANDNIQKSVLRMVAPTGIATSIITKETAVKNISSGKYEGQKVLVVLKSPIDVLNLIESGLDIKEVNVGNMANRDNTVQIKRSLNVLPEEVAAFRKLMDLGVKLTAKMVPDEPDALLEGFLAKAGL